ncbi:MAG: PAS domain S-box protein [Sphingomonadales bacterium]|nr:PAS domain S-box protein [Sphingomonadales bacterium]
MKSGGKSDGRLIDDRRVADLISEFGDLALFSLDAEGVCTRWEAVSSNMKALTRRELVGRCFEEFLPEEQRELRTFWQELECAAEQGRSEGEGWRVRKDGTRRWMRHTRSIPRAAFRAGMPGPKG